MEWPKITFFGDSQTRRSCDPETGCWIAHIAHRVAHYFQVDVRGFDGYNSAWALELMPKLFPRSYLVKVEIFVLFFGHNDAWDGSLKPLHVSVDQYERNMLSILEYLNDNGVDNSKIILITPTWYDKKSFEEGSDPRLPILFKKLENQSKYCEVLKRIANGNEIDLLDFMDISMKHEPLADLFCDGLHLSKVGSRLLFDSVMPNIERKVLAKYGKPIENLWHVIPYDQHPEVLLVLKKYQEALSKNSS